MSRRREAVGADGYLTFLLSCVVLILTGGLSCLWVSRTVAVTAWRTAATAPPLPIVVLGLKLVKGRVAPRYAARLDRALCLAEKYPDVPLLLLGGDTDGSGITEAEAGRRYLMSHGLDSARIMVEGGSRHTLENLQNARPLLSKCGWTRIAIVTSREHLARAATLARGLGLDIHPCAAEQYLQFRLVTFARLGLEALFLHWYWVGRRWSEWTRNQQSLQRIR